MPPAADSGSHDAASGSPDGAAMDLQAYLDAQAAAGGHSTIPFSDLVRPFMSPAVRLRAKQIATAVNAPRSRRRARERAAGTALRLHLGSGGNNLPGWINVDLIGARADVAWDLRHPLPFPDRSAEAVFLEHGHVSAWDGETLALVVAAVGFESAAEMPGGTSRLEPAPDSPVRIPETVYVEAVVPD